jgi:7-cyano-7-deazaguanine synthase
VWGELVQIPCGQPELDVVAPLLELEAWQVVDVGCQVAAPLERTWTCLADGAEPCWACRGCRARDAAFQQAAKPDPARRAVR